ncbi:MAG: hypothetical protein AAGA85_03445 [Bacteroidota bacterium]
MKHAVLTGDLVASTTIRANYHEVLGEIATDVSQYVAPRSIFEVYRGDSFQLLLSQPQEALLVALLFRVGLRRYSNGTALDDAWDARVSIGLGSINANKPNITTLGTLDGEAFVRSGRALDTMKNDAAFLRITSGQGSIDESLQVCTSLADALIGRWTTAQCQAIYLHLLRGLTQKEIGELLHVSQRAIGLRFESAQFHSLQPFLKYFKKIN